MSTDSIAQTDLETSQTRTVWYFTFGSNHTHPVTGEGLGKAYVTYVGDYAQARQQMLAAFGQKWSHQYPTYDAAGVDRWGLHQVPRPDEFPDLARFPERQPDSKVWSCPEPGCGYHIADDGELSTSELIAEHLEVHTAALEEQPAAVVERAERLGIPQVILTNGELVRILAGSPLVCGGLDGKEYVVRLATADEFLAVNRTSVDKYRPGGPYATRAQAEDLTRPVDLGGYG